MCFFLLAAGYFISSAGSLRNKLISKNWKIVSLTQIPSPFDRLIGDELSLSKLAFQEKIQMSYINFLKQGNYESRLLSDLSSYGIWSVNKEATELTLEYNGSKEVLFIQELSESKMVLNRKRVGEDMTVVLMPS